MFTIGVRWIKWLKRFDNLLIALDITDEKRQRALLFHNGGSEVADIFDTFPEKDKDDDYSRATELPTEYFSPRKNMAGETHFILV